MADAERIWKAGEKGPKEVALNPEPSDNTPTAEADPFEGRQPIPGLEHLGRAIVDANGVPSGSPANYEFLRGIGDVSPEQIRTATKSAVEHMKDEFPKVEVETKASIRPQDLED